MINHVASAVGAVPNIVPIKNYIRVCEKLVLDYNKDISQVADLVRGTVLCGTVEQMSRTIIALVLLDSSLAHIHTRLPEMQNNLIAEIHHQDHIPMLSGSRPAFFKRGTKGTSLPSFAVHAKSDVTSARGVSFQSSQVGEPRDLNIIAGVGADSRSLVDDQRERKFAELPTVAPSLLPGPPIQLVCVKNRLGGLWLIVVLLLLHLVSTINELIDGFFCHHNVCV